MNVTAGRRQKRVLIDVKVAGYPTNLFVRRHGPELALAMLLQRVLALPLPRPLLRMRVHRVLQRAVVMSFPVIIAPRPLSA